METNELSLSTGPSIETTGPQLQSSQPLRALQSNMSQLRPSFFPGPPLITFLPLGRQYSPPALPLGIPWHLWTPCTNPLLTDCLARAGYIQTQITQLSYEGLRGHIWDSDLMTRAAVLLALTRSPKVTRSLLSQHPDTDLFLLDDQVRVNRLPGTNSITCKLTLAQNHKIFKQRFGKEVFDFVPETVSLSETGLRSLRDDREDKGPARKVWIVKPLNSSRGMGIFLTDRPQDLPLPTNGREFLMQNYLTTPCLIKGHKFDLRLYVLLTGVDPLRVFLYKDGLVRFATEPYEDGQRDLTNICAHLTNVSVNSQNAEDFFGRREDVFSGFKWTLKTLGVYLSKQGFNWAQTWGRIEDTCVKTLLLGHHTMQKGAQGLRSSYGCYKLLGLDILLDSSMKPWVLEVNSGPVLTPDTVDFPIKSAMIPEMFNILGFHLPQDIADANDQQLREVFPNMPSFGHDPAAYARDLSTPDWSDEELLVSLESGLLHPLQLNTLRQAEQELSQADIFTRLLPAPDSARYLCYMSPEVPPLDRLLHFWEAWKLTHQGAIQILM